MKYYLYIICGMLLLSSISFSQGNNLNITGRVFFAPNSPKLDIDFFLYIYVNTKKIKTIHYNDRPCRFNVPIYIAKNDSIFLEIKMNLPQNYTIQEKRIEYFGYDVEFECERKNEAYYKSTAALSKSFEKGNYSDVITKTNKLLDDKVFEIESQKFDLLRMRSNSLVKEKKYDEA